MSKRKFQEEYSYEDYKSFLSNINSVENIILYEHLFPELFENGILFDKFRLIFDTFDSEFYEEILFNNNCITSKEYFDSIKKNIYLLKNNKYILEYILETFSLDYSINGINLTSFRYSCLKRYCILAKLIASHIEFNPKDIKNMFYEFCIQIRPDVCKFLYSMNNEACSRCDISNNTEKNCNVNGSSKDGSSKDNTFISSIYNNLKDKISKCTLYEEFNDIKNDFIEIIKLLTSFDSRVVIYVVSSSNVSENSSLSTDDSFNKFIVNQKLEVFNVDTPRYLFPHKMSLNEFIKELPYGLKLNNNKIEYIKHIPVIEKYCQFCYTNTPNVISNCKISLTKRSEVNKELFTEEYCSEENIEKNCNVNGSSSLFTGMLVEVNTHQYCNVCISELLLKEVKCPICNMVFSVDELCHIVTKPEDDEYLIREFTEKIKIKN